MAGEKEFTEKEVKDLIVNTVNSVFSFLRSGDCFIVDENGNTLKGAMVNCDNISIIGDHIERTLLSKGIKLTITEDLDKN